MQTLPRLLLIDDNRTITAALLEVLKGDYETTVAETGKQGLYATDTTDYDAIILDLQLPDMHGLAVCQQLRERGVRLPIIIISGEAAVLSKIKLLDAGANDYLTKPFSLGELKARIRAALRTPTTSNPEPLIKPLKLGDLVINPATYTVTRGSQNINLRRKEFALLECLMMHRGMVVSREALSRYAWKDIEKPWTNTVDVHIKYLRDKLDKPFEKPFIKTVHGVGYKLEVAAAEAAVPA